MTTRNCSNFAAVRRAWPAEASLITMKFGVRISIQDFPAAAPAQPRAVMTMARMVRQRITSFMIPLDDSGSHCTQQAAITANRKAEEIGSKGGGKIAQAAP